MQQGVVQSKVAHLRDCEPHSSPRGATTVKIARRYSGLAERLSCVIA
jgi:hypothetical protein